jgi:hypothetical protein
LNACPTLSRKPPIAVVGQAVSSANRECGSPFPHPASIGTTKPPWLRESNFDDVLRVLDSVLLTASRKVAIPVDWIESIAARLPKLNPLKPDRHQYARRSFPEKKE